MGFFSQSFGLCVFLGGDFDKWETLFCILLEPWVLFRPGCIVRRNQHTLYLTPKSGLHKPTSREEQGSLAPEGHRESAEVARLKPALVKPPAQFLAAPPALPRHHLPIPNASIRLHANALLLLGCPVAPLQSCSLLLSSLSRAVQQSSKGQLCSPAPAGPWSRARGSMGERRLYGIVPFCPACPCALHWMLQPQELLR